MLTGLLILHENVLMKLLESTAMISELLMALDADTKVFPGKNVVVWLLGPRLSVTSPF